MAGFFVQIDDGLVWSLIHQILITYLMPKFHTNDLQGIRLMYLKPRQPGDLTEDDPEYQTCCKNSDNDNSFQREPSAYCNIVEMMFPENLCIVELLTLSEHENNLLINHRSFQRLISDLFLKNLLKIVPMKIILIKNSPFCSNWNLILMQIFDTEASLFYTSLDFLECTE